MMKSKPKRIVIIGAGPCGIGAAWYLHKAGYPDWVVREKNLYAGGLSASFRDEAGFTWDIGGHVFFSRYGEFGHFLRETLREGYRTHMRDAEIRACGRWVPYPFQNNIDALPREVYEECMSGLASARERPSCAKRNFQEWVDGTFGAGISKYFMTALNRKTWACPLEDLSTVWVDERVSPALIGLSPADREKGWGPHQSFIYPVRGGAGAVWSSAAAALGDRIRYGCDVESIEPAEKRITFRDGCGEDFDLIISSMDLRYLIRALRPKEAGLDELSRGLRCNKLLVIGIGMGKAGDDTRSWMYFPERGYPFFRVTNLSNYSPHNVPGGDTSRRSSFLVEIAYPEGTEVYREEMVKRSIDGLVEAGLLSASERTTIESIFSSEAEPAYPIPTLARDEVLARIHARLEPMGIFSRGRFGAFLYEKGNMDDCFMQGYEAARDIIKLEARGTKQTMVSQK